MTKQEYLEFHAAAVEKMRAITVAKNADYTGGSNDPFANFSRVEAMGIASTEQGFLTRMLDKVSRLSSFVQQGTLQVKDESVEDTLFDLANYSILLAAYIKSKRPKTDDFVEETNKAEGYQLDLPFEKRTMQGSTLAEQVADFNNRQARKEDWIAR